jgi:hypothetical protein
MHAGGGTGRRILWFAITIGIVIGMFGLGRDFVLDDAVAIEQSACVTGSLNLELVFGSNFWCEQGALRSIESWRPWTVLAWWAAWRTGAGTLAFTLLNVVLHAACIYTVYGLGRDLELDERGATIATILFAPMAIHVDAVAPAVGAADLWSALFVLLCVRAFVRASPLTVPLGLLAVLSKESGVLAIAWVGVLHVLGPAGVRGRAPRRRQTLLLVLLSVATAFALVWRASVLGAWGASRVPAFVNPMVDVDLWARLPSALALIGRYHRVTILGGPLSADYAQAAIGMGEEVAWADVFLGAAALLLFGWLAWRFRGTTMILCAWAIGTSVFVSNALFVLPAMFAERLFFLATACLALLVGHGLDRACREGARPAVVHLGVGAFVAVQSVLSIAHTVRFRDELRIIEHTVETTPANARARMWFASRLIQEGRWPEAIEHVEVARAVRPHWGEPVAVAAVIEDLSGRPESALALFREAMDLEAHDATVADLFIRFLLRHGHPEHAKMVYAAHAQALGRPDPKVTIP